MIRFLSKFIRRENGAVTVDWVVLTAGVVGLVVVLVSSMQNGALGLTAKIQSFMSTWTF